MSNITFLQHKPWTWTLVGKVGLVVSMYLFLYDLCISSEKHDMYEYVMMTHSLETLFKITNLARKIIFQNFILLNLKLITVIAL